MKKIITLFLLIGIHAAAQDTLVMKDNSRMLVKVLEIKINDINYKRFEMPDGPLYTIAKDQVRYIRFVSGLKESFESAVVPAPTTMTASANDLYRRGMMDAQRYYKNPGGSFGVFCASAGCGILGLIPAVAVSSADPKEEKLGYPDRELWKNTDYRDGYKRSAKKIKQRRVWTGFGLGIAAAAITTLLLRQ